MSTPKQVVLIIGAGASNDLHDQFALGGELLKQISDRVTDRTAHGLPNLSNLLNKLGYDLTLRQEFVKHLDKYRNSLEFPSIDGFIDEVSSYPEFEQHKNRFTEIAKFSIVFHILGYEGELKNSSINGLKADAWVHELAKFIDENKILEANSNDYNLKIITFNYDRTIEHFLYTHERFKNNKEKIKTFINESIIHVYGKIGNLEWQDSEDFFEFGEQNDREQKIYKKKNAIGLMYTERIQKHIEDDKIGAWIHDDDKAKIVGSFGFSFDLINYRILHLQNLELIKNNIKVVANIYPSTDDDFKSRRFMANRIRNIKHDIELTYLHCTDYLKDILYRDILTAK